ncbi:MAG: efflux RND transporter permease subunit [Planctomycetota bacterium]|nr:efflux RND transporter permease subunit [Planctomycetota bacterium]
MIRAALKNPYLVVVHVLIVAVIGTVSLARIPADLLPTFTTSAAQIVCFYPGMPPEVMEQDIMSRLQRWTGQSSGIEHQEAKAMQGVCIVKDFFHPEVSQSEALSQVSMYAMSDMFYLPPGTIPPMVMPFDPTASVPLCLVSVSNPDMTDAELYDVAYKNLRNNLQSISGVIAPAVNGGTLRRILCYVEPEKLRAHGLTIRDVHAALRRQNVLIPAGSAKIQDREFYIYTNAIPDRVSELNKAPVTVGDKGEPILFSDIGEVKDTRQIQTNIVRVNGRTLVYVPVYRQPGANTIEIVDRIHDKLGEILSRLQDEKRNDPVMGPKMANLKLEVVMDQSVKVRESINALWIAGVLGAVFAGLVVLVFLRNLRSTLVIIIAIPVSILSSLIGLYFTGNTINAMTLGGLALAVGILIDQAIVVLDNVERHMLMPGKGRLRAAWDGTREVSVPLLVSTIRFMVVFFPVIFLSGLAKFLFTPLAMAVLFAVIASYLIAIFFVPVAAAKLMGRKQVVDQDAPGPSSLPTVGGDDAPVMTDQGWLVRGYRVLLLGSLRFKWAVLGVSAVLFVASLVVMSQTGTELFPPVDAGQFTIYVRAPSGTRIEKSEELVQAVENEIVAVIGDPAPGNPAEAIYPVTRDEFAGGQARQLTGAEVKRAQAASNCKMLISNIGVLMDWPAAYTPNTGAMDSFILVQLGGRDKTDVFALVQRLRKRLGKRFPSVEFAFDTGGILTAALNMGEPSPIHLQIAGYDLEKAHEIADKLTETISKVRGATDVRVAQRTDYPMIEVEIDRVAAADHGVTPQETMEALVSATNSSINFDPAFWIDPSNGNHYFLGSQYPEERINSLDTLRMIVVREDKNGTPVYLNDIAKFDTTKTGPGVINHRNITRVTDVFANVEPEFDLGSVVAEVEDRLALHPGLKLRPVRDSRAASSRYPQWFQRILSAIGLNRPTRFQITGGDYAGMTIELHGEIRSMRDSFVDFAVGLLLATVLVYLVMVGQFRSFVDPMIVMVTVPLGFIGVALILKLTGTRLNIQSFMGIIMMIGIVVEYTIVLLDFANGRLQEGADVEQAIVDAALVRFRPILMTSLTTILALLPMAIGFAGGEADVPLARTIVGGVIAATLLPKFVVPCLYVLVKRRKDKTEDLDAAWS